MKKELNIAAILQDKPAGTKLWSPIFGNCVFSRLSGSGIRVFPIHNGFTSTEEKSFFVTGQYTLAGEVCLFPSKQMQDWSKFAWKKGDVLTDGCDSYSIFVEFDKGTGYANVVLDFLCGLGDDEIDYDGGKSSYPTQDWSKVSEEKAKKVISHIEKCFGGKLNLETLEIEEQPEFKDGDILTYCGFIFIFKNKDERVVYSHVSYDTDNKDCIRLNADIPFASNSFIVDFKYATEEEKQQLFDALAKKGKQWDAEKKQIIDLPNEGKKCEFKPMDWCLMKGRHSRWNLCQYAYYREDIDMFVSVGGNMLKECIPYNEETKHLLGTTDDWEGGEK